MVIGYYSMVNKGRSIGNEYQCSMVSKWPMASLWQMVNWHMVLENARFNEWPMVKGWAMVNGK